MSFFNNFKTTQPLLPCLSVTGNQEVNRSRIRKLYEHGNDLVSIPASADTGRQEWILWASESGHYIKVSFPQPMPETPTTPQRCSWNASELIPPLMRLLSTLCFQNVNVWINSYHFCSSHSKNPPTFLCTVPLYSAIPIVTVHALLEAWTWDRGV